MTNTQVPQLNWVENDKTKYRFFTDGSAFLVAMRVKNSVTGSERWEFDVVEWNCDGECACLYYRGRNEIYDAWEWEDFDFFMLLDGEMPTAEQD